MRALLLLAVAVPLAAQTTPPLLGDHVEGTSALAREWVHHARASGTVVDATGAPIANARVVVYGYQPWFWALPLASTTTDAKGAWSCDVAGRGGTRLWVTSPDDKPFAIVGEGISFVSGTTLSTLPVVLAIPEGDAPTTTTVKGRVVAGDGTPIAAAFVRLEHEGRFDPAAFTTTGVDGTFAIPTRLGLPRGASVFFGNYRVQIEHKPGHATLGPGVVSRELDLSKECLVQAPEFRTHVLPTPTTEGVQFATLRGAVAVPCTSRHVHGIDSGSSAGDASVLATAPGWLPILGRLPGATFAFRDGAERELLVVDDTGRPLANVTIDVCAASDRFEETTLLTVATDGTGKVKLRGDATARHVVYAYAAGHDPARGEWTGDRPLRLECARRNGVLRAAIPTGARSLFVRRTGVFEPAAIRYAKEGEARVELAPGAYEVTCYGDDGVLAMEVVTVPADGTTSTELAKDQRPRVRIRVPKAIAGEATWWSHASRETYGDMIQKVTIMTHRGGPIPRRALAAEVDEIAKEVDKDREFALRLPTTGRFTILLANDQSSTRWFREVVAAADATYELDVPPASVTATGKVIDYPDLWDNDFAMHGIVGPRLCLEPEGDTAFGVLVALPEPATFQVHLPAPGHYVVHHHLYKTGVLWSEKGHSGGTPLAVTPDKPAELGEFALGTGHAVEFAIVDAAGEPVSGSLAVRDRMFEAWSWDLRQNTTLDDAMDPIPTPPRVRLEAGKGSLPRLRGGRVQFVVELDDGRTVFFTRDVKPGERTEVKLPIAPTAAKKPG